MNYCRKCGAKLNPNDIYCPSCGARIKYADMHEKNKSHKKAFFTVSIIIIILILIGAASVMLLNKYKIKSDISSGNAKHQAGKYTGPGNTPSNILNNGYVAKQGDWIYYTNFSDNKNLYKTKVNGKKNIKLSSEEASCINVIDNWIYYVSNDGIYKIKTDGTAHKKIRGTSEDIEYVNTGDKNEISFHDLYVIGNKIYYVGHIKTDYDTPDSYIVSLNTDGTEEKKLNLKGAPYDMAIYKDWIYYWGSVEQGGEFKIKVDGTEEVELHPGTDAGSTKTLNGIYSEKDDLYYIMNDFSSADIYKDLNSSNILKSLTGRCSAFNFSSGYIYYNKDNSLYKMSIEEGTEIKLCDADKNITNILTAGDWIYYCDSDSTLYRIKTSGGMIEKIQ